MSAIRTLLTESIDYAGLFPPASLDMATAVQNYARYRREPAAWALGRFVVPVSRLREFEAAAARPLVETPTGRPWRLALLAGPDLAGDLEMTAEFNRRHSQPGAPAVLADTIEAKASSVPGIEDIMHRMPRNLQAYIEVPIDRDPRDLLAAVRQLGARAKVRTGGVQRCLSRYQRSDSIPARLRSSRPPIQGNSRLASPAPGRVPPDLRPR